ncbi:MAG TPA: hypothetical protein VJB70_01550 [Candidatus Paceibacterota bacterium]
MDEQKTNNIQHTEAGEPLERRERSSVGGRDAGGKGWYKDYGVRVDKEEAPMSHPKVRYRGQLIMVGALFLVLAGIYVTLFLFVQGKGGRIAAVATELERNAVREKEFGELRDLVGKSGEKIEALDSYFVTSSEIVGLIQTIETFAGETDIALSFAAVSEKKDDTGAYLEMQFQTGGDFSDTMRFLMLLENLPLKLSFEKAFVENKEGDNGRRVELPGAWGGTFSIIVQSFSAGGRN